MAQRDTRLIGGIYRTGQVITTGGILTTCTAYNHNTNDVVGLYIITLQTQEQIGTAQALLQALAKRQGLYSDHVMRVHDWGLDGNRAYIATDPPRGVTLQHVMDNEDIDLRRSLDLIRQLLIGVKTLHKQGIHGLDLRPQLITVDTIRVNDRVQLDDIGLRGLLLSLGYVSSQNSSDIGFLDPRYCAPEYTGQGPIGPWTDVYQAGILLFTLVTGRLPFVGRTPAETGVLQSSSPIPSIQQYKHNTPPALQEVIEHALAKDPAQRFPSADDFINSLNLIPVPTPTVGYTRIEQEREAVPPQQSLGLTKDMPPLKPEDIDATQRVMPPLKTEDMDATQRVMPPPTTSTGLTAGNIAVPKIPTASGIYAHLCFEHSSNDIERFAITEKNIIVGRQDPKRGTMPDIDLSKLDPKMTVSRQHARINFEETFFYIEDLKSRNKTRLGELILAPLKAELLQHGDTVQFGSVRMTFEIPGMTRPPVYKKHGGK
jgi:serine/threonine protein kinase